MTAQKPLLLVFPFGLLSHYLRCLMLCRHLRLYYDIRIADHPAFASFIKQEEIDTFICKTINSKRAIESVKQFDFSWLNERVLEQVYLQQVNVLRNLKPAAVLGDHSPTLKMAAETTSIPFISLFNGYMSKYYEGDRKISRTHPVYPLLKMLPSFIEIPLTKHGEALAFTRMHKPFKKIRQKYNLSTQSGYLDELEGDINLVCDLKNFFPQKKMPPSYNIISPLFYNPHPPITTPFSARLDKNKKTILASMGSTGDWEKLCFLNDPFFEQYNIVATADQARILSAGHVIHTSFINMHDMLPFTDLVICHGGNGTIYQALLYQIPVLCKTSHCEQEWNVHVIEKKKLGKNLDRVTDTGVYEKIVEEWIHKKGNNVFYAYSEQIKQQLLLLPGLIHQIADATNSDNSVFRKSEESVDAF